MMERTFPHIIVGEDRVIRCCMQCNGQVRGQREIIHEATCRLFRRRTLTFDPPPDWRERLA